MIQSLYLEGRYNEANIIVTYSLLWSPVESWPVGCCGNKTSAEGNVSTRGAMDSVSIEPTNHIAPVVSIQPPPTSGSDDREVPLDRKR